MKEGAKGRPVKILRDALEKIRKRNKILRIADRSSGGWDTVKEYLSDDLASDSADEKRIRSAENRATAKKEAAKTTSSSQLWLLSTSLTSHLR